MSWMQGRMGAHEEAQEKGCIAGKNRESAKPTPQLKEYKYPIDFITAIGYHEHWMDGWEEGRSIS